ncbi:hypothetical protein DTO217A2_7005 [Paecilomyces variotii]|nr:hypothetical protein DTO217A2_7005 [Paecilomyces variotii]
MPANWCWWMCWALFTERTYRMWLLCNRKWKQIDVCETLYLEAILQAAEPDYSEFLKLPLSVYIRHPLRFVVAHKSHGQQLRTGWTTITPSSIADWVFSLNNVVFETHLSNMAKQNFSEVACEAITADIANISIPVKWYDPSRESEFQPPEEEDETENEFQDDFGGGEIGEDEDKGQV